jgi:hypothetical protein
MSVSQRGQEIGWSTVRRLVSLIIPTNLHFGQRIIMGFKTVQFVEIVEVVEAVEIVEISKSAYSSLLVGKAFNSLRSLKS